MWEGCSGGRGEGGGAIIAKDVRNLLMNFKPV